MRLCVLALVLAVVSTAGEGLQQVRERGAKLESDRHWDAAAALYRNALLDAQTPADRLWLLTSLGEMAFNSSDYRAARGWLKQAEEAVEGTPEDDAGRMDVWNARAALNLVEGKLSAAERDLSRAAEVAVRLGARQALAAALHNLASIEMQTGRLRHALEHQKQALGFWRQEFGDEHEYVLRGWISLSSIQALREDWRSAEESLRQALLIAETPEALANYAVVLDHLKRGKEAKAIRSRIPRLTPAKALVDAKALRHEGDRLPLVVR